MTHSAPGLWARALLLCGLCLGLAGCNIFKGVFLLSLPDPEEEAKFVLPKDAHVLILIDARDVGYVHPRAIRAFERTLREQLLANKLVAKVVEADRIDHLRRNDPNFPQRSIEFLARACNANRVIYADVKHFSLKNDPMDPTWQGRFQIALRLHDGADGKRLWPESNLGEIREARTLQEASEERDFADLLAERLGRQLGEASAKLFYRHKATTIHTQEGNVRATGAEEE